MTEAYAYSFTSELTPGAIVARFRELGPWEWDDRDSDDWGPTPLVCCRLPTMES